MLKPSQAATAIEVLQDAHFYNIFEIMDWVDAMAIDNGIYSTVKLDMEAMIANAMRGKHNEHPVTDYLKKENPIT